MLLLQAGCDGATGPDDHDGLLLRTLRAEQRWLSSGLTRYSMVERRSCECLPETLGPVRMEVERTGPAETILEMVYDSSGVPVPPGYVDGFRSVRDLFTMVRQAARDGAADLRVTFHPTLGYPTSIFIDYHAEMADDEVGYMVDSVERSSYDRAARPN